MTDQQKVCDDFNARYTIGTEGHLLKDDDTIVITHTLTAAEVLDWNMAVIWLADGHGRCLLEQFTPRVRNGSASIPKGISE